MRQIYVIGTEDGARHKIGVSRDPAQRMAYLQPGSAARLVLVRTWECEAAYRVEREAHRLLIQAAVHGEWFAVDAAAAVAAVEQAMVVKPRRRAPRPGKALQRPRPTWDEVVAAEIAQYGEEAVLAAVERFGAQVAAWKAANDAAEATIHKAFPGGVPAPVHDPATCEVR